MLKTILTWRAFAQDEGGATAIEYAMIASLLSIAVMAAVIGVGGGTSALFNETYTKVVTALTGN